MKCGYMILTFLIALAVATPALHVAALMARGANPIGEASEFFALIGVIEIAFGLFWLFFVSELPGKMMTNAKAEFDALRAGMRGEKRD